MKDKTRPRTFTAAELQQKTYPDPVWIVPGIIPEGTTVMAAKAKFGKSYMALNIALALACGGKALGSIQVAQRGVLYLSLEDRERRLQTRINSLLEHSSSNWSSNLHMAIGWPRIDEGGLILLEEFLDQHKDIHLVIIDTLAKVRSRRNGNRNPYDDDYQEIGAIKGLADKKRISIIIIHHLRKMESEDPFDCISGSTGLSAAVDTGIVLKRDSGRGLLYIRGRDVEEQELVIERDPSGGWILVGKVEDVAKSDEQAAILEVLKTNATAMKLKDICTMTGKKSPAVSKLLQKLVNQGKVRSIGYGMYMLKGGEGGESGESSRETLTRQASNFHPPRHDGGETGESSHGARQKSYPVSILSPDSPHSPNSPHLPGSPHSPISHKCFDCCSYLVNEKPNMPGKCQGIPYDGEEKQPPQVVHQCENFKNKP